MNWKLALGRLRDALRSYPEARRRIAAIPAGSPIFLTGTHRSGTTWLAKMLAASGIWYVHEPFNPNKGRWPEAFTYRNAAQADPQIDALVREVKAGGFRAALNLPDADQPWMPLRFMHPRFSRLLIKDPLACLLASYLGRRHGMQTLVLFRHPAGFAESICRLGWPRGEFLRQFLADEALMADHLHPYRALLQRYAAEDSVASAAVLHGALNQVLWDGCKGGSGRPLVFEEICADPINQAERLFAEIGLPYDERVRRDHERLCLGARRELDDYRTHAVERNSMAMAESWKSRLKVGQVDCIRSIWNEFDVPLYREDSDWALSAGKVQA